MDYSFRVAVSMEICSYLHKVTVWSIRRTVLTKSFLRNILVFDE